MSRWPALRQRTFRQRVSILRESTEHPWGVLLCSAGALVEEPIPRLTHTVSFRGVVGARQDFDQSIIIFRLDLKPGDVVVESGTGSGVMSSVSHMREARRSRPLLGRNQIPSPEGSKFSSLGSERGVRYGQKWHPGVVGARV